MERAELKALVRASGVARERDGFAFLCDPQASAVEEAQVATLLSAAPRAEEGNTEGWLCIRTGGSAGTVKFARHDEKTVGAAIDGFRRHFGLERVNAIGVLPLHHVSGLMAAARCAATGGRYVPWDWKRLEAGDLPALGEGDWTLSLVPTQLQRLLASERTTDWLRRLARVILGGGPVWPQLADAAAAARVRVSLSYGLTETAAMVTALRPEEFLAGARSSGTALPHARVTVDIADGGVRIAGESIHRGYWPEWSGAREILTEDLGRIDARGHLHLLGRRDAIIITGGKKVQPADVEAALRASGEFADVAVIGVPDREWGEVVIACYPRGGRAPDVDRAAAGLAAHQRPKRYVAIDAWPRNAQGKVNRARLRALVAGE